MRSVLVPAFILAALVPATASAAVVDASLMPDGTYTVKVEKIQDALHALVMMQNARQNILHERNIPQDLIADLWMLLNLIKLFLRELAYF